jgi:hypothetical protein
MLSAASSISRPSVQSDVNRPQIYVPDRPGQPIGVSCY